MVVVCWCWHNVCSSEKGNVIPSRHFPSFLYIYPSLLIKYEVAFTKIKDKEGEKNQRGMVHAGKENCWKCNLVSWHV